MIDLLEEKDDRFYSSIFQLRERMYSWLKIHVLVFLCFGAAVYLWLGGILGGFLGHPTGDLADHVWGNNWFAAQIASGEIPYVLQDNYFPEEKVLWHIDPIGGFFHSFLPFFPVQWTWNLYIHVQIFLSSVLLYLYSYRILHDRWVSMILGLFLLQSSYLSGLVHSGLSEYLGLYWCIALLWASHERKWLLSGILLGMCGWQAFSYGLMGAFVLFVLYWKSWRELLVTFAVSLILVSPAVYLGWSSLKDPRAAFSSEQAPGWNFHSVPSIDIFGYFRLGDWVHPDTPSFGNPGILQTHYIGWTILVIVLIGIKNSTLTWLN